MTYIIQAPQQINSTIQLPASKSICNRALVIHAMAGCTFPLSHLSDCDDTEVIVAALRDMPEIINIKAAGTAMRFMTAYLASTPGSHTITGTERMKNRPIAILVDALRRLGADIEYVEKEGFPPLRIEGKPLEGGQIEVVGSISSQYISALLMIGPVLQKGLELKLTGEIASRPYIDLTLWTMRQFGADAKWTDIDTITIAPQPYAKIEDYTIESDWSASSYWYEIMALNANRDSELKAHRCTLPRLDYDFTGSPDLAQTIVVACCAMGIHCRFTGLATLKIKETDRIEALKRELRKVGYVIRDENDNTLIWEGETCEPTLEPIDTYEDHRMAMAFAPLAFKFPQLQINHPEVVTKSYPHFWEDLRSVGFIITEKA